ncbi:MAG TPA: zf-HC2 domain-containing protein, partial [Acidimicrobiia bacterium]|nr:zf-HC2 domain-containing protein [Acidimicrobiia bacterium]
MNGIGCAATREAAPELALGVLDGAERAEVLLHLASCPSCQRYVNELAGVADGLARLAREAEPPAGFAQRVDAEIRRPRRRSRRRFATAVAAAAVAATIVSVATVQIIDAGR